MSRHPIAALRLAARLRSRCGFQRSMPRGRYTMPCATLVTLTASTVLTVACSPKEQPVPSPPSALVQLTPLRKGTLPKVVIVFGTVQASMASRRTLMAPTAAVVAAIPVRVGESVAKNAPLIRLEPAPQTAAAYSQARSALAVAAQLVQRTRQMLGQRLATRQQLADAEKSAADARAALAALRAQGAAGTSTLRAPFRAIVTAVSTSRGAVVSEGTSLLELAGADDLVVHAGIVPTAAAAIARGNPAVITSIDGTRSAQGRVSLRGGAVDPSSGLTPVDIAIPPGTLQPGEMAQALITTGTESGYLVPHEAILIDESGNPYVAQDVNGAAKKVPVRVLAAHEDQNVIDGSLDPAAPLALAGNYQLEDGMKIRVAQPSSGPPHAADERGAAQRYGAP